MTLCRISGTVRKMLENLASRILILRLGLLGLRGCHVWPISPTIFKIVGFPQEIVFTNSSALFSEPLSTTERETTHPRTSFRPNFFDNEESTKRKAEGCVYAEIAKRTRHFQTHY